jgi:antitoxin component YwqK of YwqJK toxin-antitoxin module
MKNVILVILFLLGLTNLFSQQNEVDAKGKKQGVWKKYIPNTKLLDYEGTFKDDIPVGEFIYYFKSGKIKSKMFFKENGTICYSTIFHEDENNFPMASGKYIQKLKDSVWNYWGPSGRISMKESFKNGVLHGKKIIYYVPEVVNDKSVIVAQELNYDDGELEGEQKEFFNNGVLKSSIYYKKGLIEGEVITNSPSGIIAMKDNFIHGVKEGWCYAYDENGAELSKVYYKSGVRLTDKQAEEYLEKLKKVRK